MEFCGNPIPIRHTARIANGKQFFCDAESELQKRRERISELCDRVVLDTGDEVLDTFFRLCKLHVGESVFDIKADRQKTEIYIDGKLSGSVAAGETYFYG